MSEGFGPKVVFEIAGMQITETVTVTWFIMALITLFCFIATRNLEKKATGLQLVTESIVDGINGLTVQTMGPKLKSFAPYAGMLLIYIGISNIAGLFGFRPPTADVNTTMSMSLVTFILIHSYGLKYNGLDYIKGFGEPFLLLLPMNIMGELATPISLGFRLFGNIVGGLIVMNLLYGALANLTPAVLNIPFLQAGLPAVLHLYFDLFAGLLQSFIFAMLTMVFISIAVD
ncbi:MAG: F0F1 ATP synthase subunit A [Bacillota bacterium]